LCLDYGPQNTNSVAELEELPTKPQQEPVPDTSGDLDKSEYPKEVDTHGRRNEVEKLDVEGSDAVGNGETASDHGKKIKKWKGSHKNEGGSDSVEKENDDSSHILGSDDHKVNGLDKDFHVGCMGTYLGHGKVNVLCEVSDLDKANGHENGVVESANALLLHGCLKIVFGT